MAHEHTWVELYRQIPWTVDDFDPDKLAPHRARYADNHPDEALRGQLHTDEDHAAKVPAPIPSIVVKCYGCDTTEVIPIPAAAYKRIVGQLVDGTLSEDRPDGANDLSSLPLELLVPELKPKLAEYGLAGKTGAAAARDVGGEIIYSGLEGEAALANDEKLRKQLGLAPRTAADELTRAEMVRYAAEGKKASTQPDDGKATSGQVPAEQVKTLLADKKEPE